MLRAFRVGLLVVAAALAPITAVFASADCATATPADPALVPFEPVGVAPLLSLVEVSDTVPLAPNAAILGPLRPTTFELMSPLLATPDLNNWQMLSDRYWFPLAVDEAKVTQDTAFPGPPEGWLLGPVERAVPF